MAVTHMVLTHMVVAHEALTHMVVAHMALTHMVVAHMVLAHMVLAHMVLAHMVLAHMVLTHMVLAHMVLAHMVLTHMVLTHMAVTHMAVTHMVLTHMVVAHEALTHMVVAHMALTHMVVAHMVLAHMVLAHMVLAHMVLAHMVVAHMVLAHMVLTHMVLAHMVLTHMVVAHMVAAHMVLMPDVLSPMQEELEGRCSVSIWRRAHVRARPLGPRRRSALLLRQLASEEHHLHAHLRLRAGGAAAAERLSFQIHSVGGEEGQQGRGGDWKQPETASGSGAAGVGEGLRVPPVSAAEGQHHLQRIRSPRLQRQAAVSQRSQVPHPAAPRAASHSAGPRAQEPVAMHHGGCVHEAHQQRGLGSIPESEPSEVAGSRQRHLPSRPADFRQVLPGSALADALGEFLLPPDPPGMESLYEEDRRSLCDAPMFDHRSSASSDSSIDIAFVKCPKAPSASHQVMAANVSTTRDLFGNGASSHGYKSPNRGCVSPDEAVMMRRNQHRPLQASQRKSKSLNGLQMDTTLVSGLDGVPLPDHLQRLGQGSHAKLERQGSKGSKACAIPSRRVYSPAGNRADVDKQAEDLPGLLSMDSGFQSWRDEAKWRTEENHHTPFSERSRKQDKGGFRSSFKKLFKKKSSDDKKEKGGERTTSGAEPETPVRNPKLAHLEMNRGTAV
ncbi:uncharacterized protein arhgef33 isoform 2-T2 [Spinachia spinachia]